MADVKRAVIYARFSCSKQREASIDDQLRVCREWCDREGYEVVREYSDYAMSGRSDDRPQFQEMIANAGESDIVLVYMMDRFSRSEYDAPIYKKELAKHGVKVVSAMEALPDGPEKILIEKIYEGLAAVESAKTSIRVKRGMGGNALKCLTNGVRIYGYRTAEDGRFEIDPDAAKNVAWAYKMRLRGTSVNRIGALLAERGVKNSTGGLCNYNMARKILTDERYTGVYLWDDVRIDGGMPQIIDRGTFMAAQQVKSRKCRADETWGDYALKGKALCGECGRSLQGISGYGCKGVRYEYYSCPTKCQKNIRRDVLEGEIVKALRTMLSDRSTAMMIARALCGLQSHGALNAEKKRAQKALSDAEKGLKNLLAAVEQGIIVPGTQERIQELEAQKLRAQRDLENAKAEEVDPEGFADFLMYGEELDDRNLLRAFVYQVMLMPESVVVTLNYDEENGEPARINFKRVRGKLEWCPMLDSNQRPSAPEADALIP